MARMLPDTAPATASLAERRIFRTLKRDLSDHWSALHSLGLLGHPRKPWAEIDFVLIGPPGIFCLEVKGGRISRERGRWIFTTRHDEQSVKREGPFEQVGSAAAQLRRQIADAIPSLKDMIVGFGVLTPDIHFAVRGPDIDPVLVYDAGDRGAPISRYLQRLAEYWQRRYPERRTQLKENDHLELVDLLRGDFDLRPTLRVQMGNVTEELVRLTERQSEVLERLTENERVLIRGGAGTGKTVLALEELTRLGKSGGRVLYCCYSRRLAAQIRLQTEQLGPHVAVRHLHGLMVEIVRGCGLEERLPQAEKRDLFQVFYPEVALEALLDQSTNHDYDVIIVDEAQDLLTEPYLDVLDAMLIGGISRGQWRIFLDPKQNVFLAAEPKGLKRLLDAPHAEYRLTVNCRNTAPIGTNTSLLSGVTSDEMLIAEGPDVELYWYQDLADQKRQLGRHLNRLLSDGASPDDIVILGQRKLSNSCLSDSLASVPVGIEPWDDRSSGSSTLGYCTITGFKGLESNIVVLVDVDDLESPEALSLMYTGASRARVFLSAFLKRSLRDAYEALARRFGESLRGPDQTPH